MSKQNTLAFFICVVCVMFSLITDEKMRNAKIEEKRKTVSSCLVV
jgi:uncharacterized membrane protein